MTYTIKKAETSKEFADCVYVRSTVFIEEQQDSISGEFDGLDDNATHFIAYDSLGEAVATCRFRLIENGSIGKLERVAVLKSARGQGVAGAVCQAAMDEMVNQGAVEAKTHAQSYVASLYEKLGFESYGDEFMEAAIAHRAMRRPFKKSAAA